MRKTGSKGRAFAAALTAALAVSLTAGATAGYAATDDYDWDGGADKSSYAVPFKITKEGLAGLEPGLVADTDSSPEAGPSVSQSALSEQYHADYKIYEESLEGIFFFYSSVANGGITHEPVELDLPANLTWTVEKDGQPWTYVPGQVIREHGTYVFRIYGVEDDSLPLSEQKEYRAVFRFRIQEKPPEESKPEGSALSSGAAGGYNPALVFDNDTLSGLRLEPGGTGSAAGAGTEGAAGTGSAAGAESTVGTEGAAGTEGTAGTESADGAESAPGADGAAETEAAGASAGDGNTGGAVPASADPAGTVGEPADGSGDGKQTTFTQSYDPKTKKYEAAFAGGISVTASVPGGYIGAGPVEITVPEDSREGMSLYRNDVPVAEAITENGTLNVGEPGYYRLETGGGTWPFAVMTATSRMDVYPAPVGMKIRAATLDGQPLALASGSYVLMEKDGQYGLTLEGEAGETMHVGILKDTEPPQIEVTVGKGSATINYLSDDIDDILLEKSGEAVEGFRGYSITQPGDYRLTVTDMAGNTAGAAFTLKYQVNTYGIAAVLLIILVIIGLVAFVIHTKRTVKVR